MDKVLEDLLDFKDDFIMEIKEIPRAQFAQFAQHFYDNPERFCMNCNCFECELKKSKFRINNAIYDTQDL